MLLDGEDYSHLDSAVHYGASSVQLLSVAIAVVVRDGEVLLVCRRDNTEGIRWGFPTGVVKPGRISEHVAVSETLAETGVHCAVRSELGTRLHPMTGALCAYFLADHLAGEPDNRDPVENSAVTWAPVIRLTDFIPPKCVYPPILNALGVLMPDAQPTIVAAIVTSPRGVLLGRRHDGKPPWTFIAGAMELGESPQDTAIRECREETGLEVIANHIIGDRIHPKTGRHMTYVACRPADGTEVVVGDSDELAEVAWRSPAELDDLMPYGVFEPVAEHLARELP